MDPKLSSVLTPATKTPASRTPATHARRRNRTPAVLLGLAVLAGAWLAPPDVAAQQTTGQSAGRSVSVPLAANAPERYVVKKGDTLWDIAGVFLREPWYWPELWYANPSIKNPHLIYPGDVLFLTWVNGRPRLSVEQPSSQRLSPQVRSEPLADAVRAIPYDLLMNFVGRPLLLDKNDLKTRPHVVGIRDRHLIGSDMNEIYAQGIKDVVPGTRYTIVHRGDELRDPDDGALLGYMGHYAGTAETIDTTYYQKGQRPVTHLAVVDAGREILQGDKLFPVQSDAGGDFVLKSPRDTQLNGQVIAVTNGVYVAGKYQVIAINRGKRHGLVPGDAISIFERGEKVYDREELVRDRHEPMVFDRNSYSVNYDRIRLPEERSGTVLLFRVYDRMSYGLVVESTHVMRVGDFIRHPSYGHRDISATGRITR